MQEVANRSRVDVGEVERESRAQLTLFAEGLNRSLAGFSPRQDEK
jgi:hypothetical protein